MRRLLPLLILLLIGIFAPHVAHAQSVSINLASSDGPGVTGRLVQLTALITVLALAPSILVMVTAFTRIVIVLSLLRSALGLQTTPPNIVLIGLALFLTFFVMQPVLHTAWVSGLLPLEQGKIGDLEGLRLAAQPFRRFMLANLRPSDLQLFLDVAKLPDPANPAATPWRALIPAFLVGELRRAFGLPALSAVPSDRHGYLECADEPRHDDAAADGGLAPLQAGLFRTRGRLASRGGKPVQSFGPLHP